MFPQPGWRRVGRILGQVIDLQDGGGQIRCGTQLLHRLCPGNGSVSRPEMLVLLPMVVMDMSGSDEGLQFGDGCSNATAQVRVTHVETHTHIFEVANAHDLQQVDRSVTSF